MNERQQLVSEYFKLYVLLNKANRYRNEKTELSFEFLKQSKNWDFYASLENSTEHVRIKLCEKNFSDHWTASGFSGLHLLEDFVANAINQECQKLKIQRQQNPSAKQFALLITEIKAQLRGLRFE